MDKSTRKNFSGFVTGVAVATSLVTLAGVSLLASGAIIIPNVKITIGNAAPVVAERVDEVADAIQAPADAAPEAPAASGIESYVHRPIEEGRVESPDESLMRIMASADITQDAGDMPLDEASLAAPVAEPADVVQPASVPALSERALRVMQELREQNGLDPVDPAMASFVAAENIGYIPRVDREILDEPDRFEEFSRLVPGLSSVPAFRDRVTDAALPAGEIDAGDVPGDFIFFSGPPSLTEEGLVSVKGDAISLVGVVFPSSSDHCASKDGEEYDCAAWARSALETGLEGHDVFCTSGLASGNSGECEIGMTPDPVDLGKWAVLAGVAIPAKGSSLYAEDLRQAKAAGRGLWSGVYEIANPGEKVTSEK